MSCSWISLTCFAMLQGATITPEQIEFFEKQVRPIFAEHCFSCHSTRAKTPFAGLLFDNRATVFKDGIVTPGNPAQSRLIRAVKEEGAKSMPPTGKLAPAKILTLAKWVEMGAPWPEDLASAKIKSGFDLESRRRDHWAWQPVKPQALPPIKDKTWPLQPIDRFLLSALEQRGLKPAAAANHSVWLRRVTFDLTGLPPSLAELAAFDQDHSPSAYENVVDRLLESPRYGERWARSWMDLVRYAESHGSEGDPDIPLTWRYRDYLIRAFNSDVPYDQLIREHLAGDLIPPRVNQSAHINESVVGLAFYRMVEHGFQPVDPWEDRVKWTDNQVDVFSKAFQGLTVSCARCHDHKFDAISQKDYYALFGIFANARPTQIPIDDESSLNRNRTELVKLKVEIKTKLADAWTKQVDAAAVRLIRENPWFTFNNLESDYRNAAAFWQGEAKARLAFNQTNFTQVWDPSKGGSAGWANRGSGQLIKQGDFSIESEGNRLVTSILPSGVYTHLLSRKHAGVITSPRFKIETDSISMRLSGAGGSAARLIVENYAVPRGGIYNQVLNPKEDSLEWSRWDTTFWKGFTAYIEFATAGDLTILAKQQPPEGRSWIGIQQVAFHNNGLKPKDDASLPVMLLEGNVPSSEDDLFKRTAGLLRAAITAWQQNGLTQEQAALLDYGVRSGILQSGTDVAGPMVNHYRKLEKEITVPLRAPGIIEEAGQDQELLIRGGINNKGPMVPRKFLTALDSKPYADPQTMRLQLANEVASPNNPLTARVMVNRIWRNLFRRGIVPTVDNFGKLGDKPSHPELLDYLANQFVEQGWSIKKMVRMLATSQAYRMSSSGSESDTSWQHMPLRRLEAEEIRDTILSVSGELDQTMFGPSVTVYYSHDEGKTKGDKPKGPLDGAGRRSIYMEVRRNATNPFLDVFDVPKPSTTRGERDVTNVPAQSLTLMNSPFVIDQARKWANRNEDIDAMFVRALGRKPTSGERDAAESFLAGSTRDGLAHAIFNLKEFIYVR